jgi:hypothetical protein
MICYAQHFSELHAGTEPRVCHNTPAWQWRPIMQLATGRLLLRCVTSRWKGALQHPQCLPLHRVQWQPGGPSSLRFGVCWLGGSAGVLSLVVAAAAAVPAGGGQAAMQALFQPKHSAELANFLMLPQVCCGRCGADAGRCWRCGLVNWQ